MLFKSIASLSQTTAMLFPSMKLPAILTAMIPTKPSETAKPTYNGDDYDCAGTSVVLTFEYGLVKIFLSEWCEMKTK